MRIKKYGVYLFAGIAMLPVLLTRDFTPANELRYLSIVDEALQHGNFFAFTNQGLPYADKPPLYFWLLMFARSILGEHAMWLYLTFSIVPTWIVVHTMNRWTEHEVYREFQSMSTYMMLTCGVFLGIALFLRPDMLFCMFIVLALHTFYRLYKNEGNVALNRWLFPLYIFLGILSKGPLAFFIPLLSTLIFLGIAHRLSTFATYWGWRTWTLLLGGCAVWWTCVYFEGGADYLNDLLFRQTLGRAIDAFHHKQPFWYYAATIWYGMQPWALLIIGTIVASLCKRQHLSELQKFFVTIIAVTFVLLSAISSKIEVYLLPAYPFFVYMAVMMLSRYRFNHWQAVAIAIPAVAFILATPILLWVDEGTSLYYMGEGPLYAAAGILSMTGLTALYELYHFKSLHKAIVKLSVGLFIAIFVGGFAMHKLNARLGYADLCHAALDEAKTHAITEFAVLDVYRAVNMDVYLDQDVRFVTRDDLAQGKLHHAILFFSLKHLDFVKQTHPQTPIKIIGNNGFIAIE